jgi:D-sedoheptulose 7-phosphate isomerase
MTSFDRRLHEKLNMVAAAVEKFTGKRVIDEAAGAIVDAIRGHHLLTACGNGGSGANADHLVAEFIGRFRYEREPMSSFSLNSLSAFTAISNDYGYEQVYARQVRGLMKGGDVLALFSSSGNSPNIIAAARAAREVGAKTIGFSAAGGKLNEEVDILISVDEGDSEAIEEAHGILMHLVCELAEEQLCATNPEAINRRKKPDLSDPRN